MSDDRPTSLPRPTASVALCTYNGAPFIEEQLRSIIDQTHPLDEIVVFDDRSIDDTVAIVRRVASAAAMPFRIVVNEVRQGSTANFLTAVMACTGRVIFLSDQDDVWRSDKVELMLACFAADNALGLVLSDAEAVDEQLRPLGYRVLGSLPVTAADRRRIGRGEGSNLVLKRPFGTGSSMAFRRELLPAIVGLARPADLIHDSWILTVADAMSRIAILNEPLNLYRQHPGQQVGAPPKWRASSAKAATTGGAVPPDRASHRRQLETYVALQRSLADPRFAVRPSFAHALSEAIRHAKHRLSLPPQLLARAAAVAGELRSGRYSRHSSGLKSVAKDLISL